MASDASLTEIESRYLKLIYRKQHEESKKISTTALSDMIGVTPATVTETLQELSKKKILDYEPYHGVQLTETGVSEARELLRKHRLLELLFSKGLGHSSKESCEEASKLDYHVSDGLISSICRNYGHPDTCPCGKEIFGNPTCKGER